MDKKRIAKELRWFLLEMDGTVDDAGLVDEFLELINHLESPPYSHRNGESTTPTVEGWYWLDVPGFAIYIVSDEDILEEIDNCDFPESVRIYGPIPQPAKGEAR